MRKFLSRLFKSSVHNGIVLMYHRIAEPVTDVWEIAVSQHHFEQHLQLLQKMGNVVPLHQMVNEVSANKNTQNTIAITFDDGYADNYTTASPLLEQYHLPATFFIASGNLGTDKEFWWDELEYIILNVSTLPAEFNMSIAGNEIVAKLHNETELTASLQLKHSNWKACTEAPPTQRANLFYQVWEQLRPLKHSEQQQILYAIKHWANIPAGSRASYKMMRIEELQLLSSNNLFTIGAHSVTHPALAYHNGDFQRKELAENQSFLKKTTGTDIDLLAYPYGNYNDETMKIASNLQFKAAFSTEEQIMCTNAQRFNFGRFQVKNMDGVQFQNQLNQWMSK